MEQKDAIPGAYEVTENGTVIVELHRWLPGRHPFDITVDGDRLPMLYGTAYGLPITAVRCRYSNRNASLLNDHAKIELRPWVAIEGLLMDEAELHLTEAYIQVEYQEAWAQHESFPITKQGRLGFPLGLRHKPLRKTSARILGGRAHVEDASVYVPGEFEIALKSRSQFRISLTKPVTLDEFSEHYVRSLLLLMTLATGRDCGVLDIHATCRTWVIQGERHAGDRWVAVRMGHSGKRTKPMQSHELLFSLPDMEWSTQARHIFEVTGAWVYPLELWATLTDPSFSWPLGRFANAIQAVEALDRIIHPEPEFIPDKEMADEMDAVLKENGFNNRARQKAKEAFLRPRETALDVRISRLSNRVSVPMEGLMGEQPWPTRIARLRHVASHGLKTAERFTKDVRAPQVATEILLYLLECLYLERLGFEQDRILELQRRRSNFGYRVSTVKDNFHLLSKF